MIVDPNNFNMLSNTPSLGSQEYVDGSFTIPSQSVSSSYVHPAQLISTPPIEYLATAQVNLGGLETVWRTLYGATVVAFDRNDQFYYEGSRVSTLNASSKFRVWIFSTYSPAGLRINISYYCDLNPSGTAVIPAITFNVRAYFYSAPI